MSDRDVILSKCFEALAGQESWNRSEISSYNCNVARGSSLLIVLCHCHVCCQKFQESRACEAGTLGVALLPSQISGRICGVF